MEEDRLDASVQEEHGYLAESRSFALSTLSILPLIALYQVGIVRSGYPERNLAELWLVGPLRLVGLGAAHALNVALVVAFVAALVRSERTRSLNLAVVTGILGEGALYAALLYRGAPAVAGILDERARHVFFAIHMPPGGPLLLALGAGVYEELLFRLLLVGGGALALRVVFLWERVPSVAVPLAVSSVLFALAHHVGPSGEPLESYSFLFRTVCGLLLGAVFLTRGLGVAVWTHAIYNALVMMHRAG